MSAAEFTEALSAAAVLGPNDKLVLVIEGLTAELFHQFTESIAGGPFDGRVLVVGARAELAVLRGES